MSPRKLRAPADDGAALIEPPLREAAHLAIENNRAAQARRIDVHGQSLWKRSAAARLSLLRAGASLRPSRWRRTIDGWLDVDAGQYAPPIIMAGHQPTLFHPGVWLKSFILSSLSRALDIPAINLIVDTDLVPTTTIAVPHSSGPAATVQEIAFDAPQATIPWECRRVLDMAVFESFADRARASLAATPRMQAGRTILEAIWPAAVEAAKAAEPSHALLGRSLASARHQFESQLGLATEEVPLSVVCNMPPFSIFVEFLLHQLPRLHQIYNEVLREYRILNRVRGRGRPVPDLASEGDWLEAPLWATNFHQQTRRPLFVRHQQGQIDITDRDSRPFRLPGTVGNPADDIWAALVQYRTRRGIGIRPRALITTMFARLVLSDLFIHGIGGAKYDKLTDEIIRRLFGIEPPRYLTATATFRLPIERPGVTIEEVRSAARAIRDVRYRPESLIGHPLVAGDAALERELQALAAEKREYVRAHTLRRAQREVFEGLDRINASMHDKLKLLEAHLRAEHVRLTAQLLQARALGSREFSFVLYPEEYLVPRLLALAAPEK